MILAQLLVWCLKRKRTVKLQKVTNDLSKIYCIDVHDDRFNIRNTSILTCMSKKPLTHGNRVKECKKHVNVSKRKDRLLTHYKFCKLRNMRLQRWMATLQIPWKMENIPFSPIKSKYLQGWIWRTKQCHRNPGKRWGIDSFHTSATKLAW